MMFHVAIAAAVTAYAAAASVPGTWVEIPAAPAAVFYSCSYCRRRFDKEPPPASCPGCGAHEYHIHLDAFENAF